MNKLVLSLLFSLSTIFGESKFSEPKPTIENPRKIILQVSLGDDKYLNSVLNMSNNILEAYSPEKVNLAVVAIADGIKLLQKTSNKDIIKRVKDLQMYDVEFIACENTMQTRKISKDDLIDNISFTGAGAVEITERNIAGWTNIKP
jgi:hypothetical protein